MARSSFERRYRRSLAAHLEGDGEEEALDIGRSALAEGHSLLDVMAVHQAVVPELVKSTKGAELRRRFEKTDEFLSQAVAPFEMINRGWREMIDRLRGMNEQLERQVAERTAALSESEQMARGMISTALDAFVQMDEGGLIVEWNPQAEITFGWPREEAIGKELAELIIPPADRAAHRAGFMRFLATGESTGSLLGKRRELTALRRDGREVKVELAVTAHRRHSGYVFNGFVRDVTEQRAADSRLQQLQTELLHVSRFSAMGQMGSALAHEINQPLAAISNYLGAGRHLLERSQPPAEKIREILDKAAEQAVRAGEIIRQLRSFVAKGETQRRPEAIGAVVEEATALAMIGTRHQNVRLNLQLDPDARIAVINRIQVQQVLVNLVRNAVEAMSESPRRDLSIATRSLGDGGIEVAIADTGPGLAPEVSAQLFKPFVSTKSHGMGVGLSICQSIVEAHRGRIWAEANPVGGTVFRFTLPRESEAQ
jgi:two-component system, LuxR family, sensor kinase FixL